MESSKPMSQELQNRFESLNQNALLLNTMIVKLKGQKDTSSRDCMIKEYSIAKEMYACILSEIANCERMLRNEGLIPVSLGPRDPEGLKQLNSAKRFARVWGSVILDIATKLLENSSATR